MSRRYYIREDDLLRVYFDDPVLTGGYEAPPVEALDAIKLVKRLVHVARNEALRREDGLVTALCSDVLRVTEYLKEAVIESECRQIEGKPMRGKEEWREQVIVVPDTARSSA